MLNLFKKPEKPTEVLSPPNPPTLEIGKEVSAKDPKTGETVYQRAISPEHRKAIVALFQKNSQLAQSFLSGNRQRLAIDEKLAADNKAIVDSEKEIDVLINKIRDDMKIDRRWAFNMQLGILERRDPPEG